MVATPAPPKPSYAVQVASAAGAARARFQDEAELRFVRTLGAGQFEVGERFDEGEGKRGWLDTPYGV